MQTYKNNNNNNNNNKLAYTYEKRTYVWIIPYAGEAPASQLYGLSFELKMRVLYL